ncbi:hypothetical protein [Acinetobacter nosocomialis]|uniref:hypothetical protein n=1 Tax=Acinetobacter nosocomialis TaxID=106654 RepID=UPI00125097BE|nr:hypothetical protein [Acinetobacter nosocomialis]
MKRILLLSFIFFHLLTPAYAQEVKYKNIVVNLKDHWDISKGQNGELVAIKQESKQAIIISIYYPKGIEEGMQYLVASPQIPKQGLVKMKGVRMINEDINIPLSSGMNYQANVFTTNFDQRFLISASSGTNAGVVLVTYEGEGNDTNKAINDFKTLINNIKIEAPKDGFLFNQNDLLRYN